VKKVINLTREVIPPFIKHQDSVVGSTLHSLEDEDSRCTLSKRAENGKRVGSSPTPEAKGDAENLIE